MLQIVQSHTCLCKVFLQDFVTSPLQIGLQQTKNLEDDIGSPPYDHVSLQDMRQHVYIATLGLT